MASDQGEPTDDDEGTVLSPDELDITSDESVEEIDDGRYVISPDESAPVPIEPDEPDDEPEEELFEPDPEPAPTALTADDVHEWLRKDLGEAKAQYGFDISAKFEDGVDQETLYSNDIVTTFENLLVWYAQRAGGDTPIEEVLGILLLESGVPITFPPRTLHELVKTYDLQSSDTIGDLLAAVKADDDVRFPP